MFEAMKQTQQRFEEREAFTDFIKLAGCVMTSDGLDGAARRAQEKGWTRVAQALTKATVAGTTVAATGITTTLLSAFLASVRNIGVVDTIAQSAMRVPDRFLGRIGVYSSIAASSISEGAAKPLKSLSLGVTDFTPVKVAATVVLTNEAIMALGDEGIRILGVELRNSVAVGSDSAFLAGLSGNSGESQGDDSWLGVNADLEELLRLLGLGAGSKPYLIMTPSMAKSLAVRGLVNGIDSLRWNGGSYVGVEILVSDAQTPGRISAVDGSGLVILLGDLELRSSQQALIEMSDTPSQTSAPTVSQVSQVSMFQTNSRCLIAERSIAVKGIRGTAWAHVTNVQLGVGFDSPASF